MLKWLWISLLVITLDQLTKLTMANWLDLYDSVAVSPFFNLVLTHNSGAAFSFLAGAGGWQRWFFVLLAGVIVTILLVWLKRLNETAKMEAIAISLIIGGALGNVIDRILYGYVIDFIDIYIGSSHWPAFNVADAAICIGAVLLVLDSFRKTTKK